jgi:hypothetical protein
MRRGWQPTTMATNVLTGTNPKRNSLAVTVGSPPETACAYDSDRGGDPPRKHGSFRLGEGSVSSWRQHDELGAQVMRGCLRTGRNPASRAGWRHVELLAGSIPCCGQSVRQAAALTNNHQNCVNGKTAQVTLRRPMRSVRSTASTSATVASTSQPQPALLRRLSMRTKRSMAALAAAIVTGLRKAHPSATEMWDFRRHRVHYHSAKLPSAWRQMGLRQQWPSLARSIT